MDEDTTSGPGSDPTPGTYGELRRWLEERGGPWTVDPLVSDDEPLPEFPLGALSDQEDELVAGARVGDDMDVRELIAQFPPNDPALRRRWAQAGLPLDRKPEPLTGDRPDTAYREPRTHGAEGESPTKPEDDSAGHGS